MAKYDSGLNNLSYTNKDFNSIYNELLDLADRISPKWKPSQSNESDPGVLMLKLDAIIGDKNNYNIDKNILEVFPSSVTQYPAAREIFDQCGYIMPYYRAAEVIVSLNMRKEPEEVLQNPSITGEDVKNRLYALKDFTMLCNEDNSIVYTIVEDNPFLTSDGYTYEYKALQGTIKEYTLNNSPLITYNSLDYNNRIYFKELNIAENGIFIQNVKNDINQRNYRDWKKVTNLMTEPLNTYCYKFGISKDGSKCYIEFPNDIANLIGQGLNIHYITTSGYVGNISDYTLNKFFEDTYTYVSNAASTKANPENRYNTAFTLNDNQNESKKITLTTDNVYIRNVRPSYDGADPETIEDAKKNYERTKNTFETLVSLRDYNNFLLNSDQVSNGFICDRSNDIQSSTKIVTTDGNLETIHTQVKNKSIKYKQDGTIIPEDNNSETPYLTLAEPEMSAFDLKIYALKYVHPVTSNSRFDLSFELASPAHLDNVKDDMEEIKSIQHNFQELKAEEPIYIQLRYPIYAKIIPYNKLETLQQLDIQNKIATKLYESLNSNQLIFGEEIDYDSVYDTIINSDNRIKSLILDDFDYEAFIVFKDRNGNERAVKLPESFEKISNTDISNGGHYDNENWDSNVTYEVIRKWCNTIRAKAILAGVTPLLETPENNFNFSIAHTEGVITTSAGKINTESKMTIKLDDKGEGSVVLTPNESIYLTTNNYITKETYTNYVKYFYQTGSKVIADCLYQLIENDYFVFFWKEKDNDNEPYHYAKYTSKSSEKVVSPNFTLNYAEKKSSIEINSAGVSADSDIGMIFKDMESLIDHIISELKNDTGVVSDDWKISNKSTQYSNNTLIQKCDRGTILDKGKSIAIKGPNFIELKNNNHQYKLYWILNETENTLNNELSYKLFKSGNTYTLKTGEYLFYSDTEGKIFSMVGPGTKLEKLDKEGNPLAGSLSVKAKSYEEVIYGANDLLNDEQLWYILPNDITIKASEMMFYNIGAESKVTFTNTNRPDQYLQIDNSSIKVIESLDQGAKEGDLNRFSITYTYQGNTVELPTMINIDTKWIGYSILNLNCGPDIEQSLCYQDSPSKDDQGNIIDTLTKRIQKIEITKKLRSVVNHIDPFEPIQDDDEVKQIVPSSETPYINFQSNYAIQALGGTDIDVTAYDMTGARYNNSFYYYSINDSVDQDKIKTEDFNVEVELDYEADTNSKGKTGYATLSLSTPPASTYGDTISKAVLISILTLKEYDSVSIHSYSKVKVATSNDSYTLTAGNYYQLVGSFIDEEENPIFYSFIKPTADKTLKTLENSEVYQLTLEDDFTPLNDIDLNTKGLKFFAKNLSSSFDLFIEAKNKSVDSTNTSRIKFLPVIPYLNEDELKLTSGSSGYDLFQIIKDLDTDNKFNYAHEVSNDVLIENPLDPYSFLDGNHPYNPATICKWDYENSTIKITNKIK